MKFFSIYASVLFLILIVMVYLAWDNLQTREETILMQKDVLESRRDEVYQLKKLNEEQKSIILQRDKIIDQMNSAYNFNDNELKLQNDQYLEMKQELIRMKEEMTKLEELLNESKATELVKVETGQEPEKEVNIEPKQEPEIKEDQISNEDIILKPVNDTVEIPDESTSEDTYENRMTVEATAYTAFCQGCSGFTATGIDVRNTVFYEGLKVVAVDPNFIPLYSKIRIHLNDGSSFDAIALDVGGMIKGKKIDILVSNHNEAVSFGRQQIEITILE